MNDSWTRAEAAILRRLRNPPDIQRFLDNELAYNKEPDGPTCRSPRRVLRDGVGHCMEGALLAAAALRMHGHRPLLVDLEAVHDDDHVLAVYRRNNGWGAVAKSNYAGLRSREPIYRTLRELVLSYFEHYYNDRRQKTLRGYSRPLDLRRFDGLGWMTAEDDVWPIPERLCEIQHYEVITPSMMRDLAPVDERLFAAGMLGMAK